MTSYAVAITGASGAAYGVRLIAELLKRGDDVHSVVSPSGVLVIGEELSVELDEKDLAASFAEYVKGTAGSEAKGELTIHGHDDMLSSLSSGSAAVDSMVICPCSMGTLARVATGVSGNLIERAADCMIKEGRPLVIVPRETPLSAIHLENMLKLSRLGVKVVPAMPAFYHGPKTIDDMVAFVTGKVMDALGVKNELYKRWQGR